MKKVILVRYGEIMLKGLNRPMFEKRLAENIRKALAGMGKAAVVKSQGRMFVEPREEGFDFEKALEKLRKVFGVVSVSPVWKFEAEMDRLKNHSLQMVQSLIEQKGWKTFKVETKRGNKSFPLKSPEISREVGAHLLRNIKSLKVDVNNPDFVLYIEVREHAYIYSEIIRAFGGIPVGTSGRALLLLSGGIDSPVAGWMMAKRGVQISAVHFYSYPYTSQRSKEKVIELARVLAEYCQRIRLHVIPFTDIQLQIYERCPHDQATVIMRRAMIVIGERLAKETGAQALVTGESLGQVASQTMQSIVVTDAAVSLPVFRPLIGMDKNEVIEIARRIGTFDISTLPYEDCCTVFVARHPKTKPKMERILLHESKLYLEELIEKAIREREIIDIESR